MKDHDRRDEVGDDRRKGAEIATFSRPNVTMARLLSAVAAAAVVGAQTIPEQ